MIDSLAAAVPYFKIWLVLTAHGVSLCFQTILSTQTTLQHITGLTGGISSRALDSLSYLFAVYTHLKAQ